MKYVLHANIVILSNPKQNLYTEISKKGLLFIGSHAGKA